MSKITIDVFFETCGIPRKKPHLSSWSWTKFTFFWSAPYHPDDCDSLKRVVPFLFSLCLLVCICLPLRSSVITICLILSIRLCLCPSYCILCYKNKTKRRVSQSVGQSVGRSDNFEMLKDAKKNVTDRQTYGPTDTVTNGRAFVSELSFKRHTVKPRYSAPALYIIPPIQRKNSGPKKCFQSWLYVGNRKNLIIE